MQSDRRKRQGVMLAFPVDEKRLARMPDYVFLQPKLNGERCKAEWNATLGLHELKSSSGLQFRFLDHIQEDLLNTFPGVSVDGELYVHGWSRETIHSVVSRKKDPHPYTAMMKFHYFDLIYDDIQEARIDKMNSSTEEDLNSLKLVYSHYVHKGLIDNYTRHFVEDGYEGAIIRNPAGLYEEKRSNNLLKFKPEKTDRYLITGWKREVDKYGNPKDSLGALQVRGDDGVGFCVGSGAALTKEARASLWAKRTELPGKWARVKHSTITTVHGAPTCTSLVSIEY